MSENRQPSVNRDEEVEVSIPHAGERKNSNPGEHEPDWTRPLPAFLPRPTYWPAVVALGLFLFLLGVLTSWIFAGVGLILAVLALRGWIGEIRYDHRQHESDDEPE